MRPQNLKLSLITVTPTHIHLTHTFTLENRTLRHRISLFNSELTILPNYKTSSLHPPTTPPPSVPANTPLQTTYSSPPSPSSSTTANRLSSASNISAKILTSSSLSNTSSK